MDNETIKKNFHLLLCPKCKFENLGLEKDTIICKCCKSTYNIVDGIPIMLANHIGMDVSFSIEKWNTFYKDCSGTYEDIDEYLYSQDIEDVLKYINPLWSDKMKCIYMEIGCGHSLIGLHMVNKGHAVIGIDTSFEALRFAKNIYQRKNAKGFFVCADINNIPFKNESIDLVYGGGVIEHVKNLDMVVSEVYRIMRKSGNAFNTVPYMSLGSLTYRQIWGNIPDFPVLKQAAEFFHIKLLGGKHMKFGYEKSFTMSKLKKVFSKAGFKKNEIDFFDCNLKFDFIKNERAKHFFNKLAKYRLFWPMVYINSLK